MNNKQAMQWVVTAAISLPAAAWAHVGQGDASGGFLLGAGHPFSGADHLLAMLAVGIWAAQNGGRSVFTVPAAFVSLMLTGAAVGMAGLPLPYVEQGIVASLLVLGLLIVGACRMNVLASMMIVGFFALFHGHAHGVEMPLTSDVLGYAIGFTLATALLHGLGIAAATLERQRLTRFAGVAIALSGIYLAVT
ncbi:HupE/UreJ family protein [Propionivibrio sp.]|uniref:HupE/UreJ family protein n=1 Tax=Propionivibrio sp. TaxID=2212460 RepID=UPI00262820CD|nr:HupE/UreJ family protein [Propionivibrio sp.]